MGGWSKDNSQLCLRIQMKRPSSVQLPRAFNQQKHLSSPKMFTSTSHSLKNTPSHPSRPSLGSSVLMSCTSAFASSSSGHSVHSWKDDLSGLPTCQERCQVACDDISASSYVWIWVSMGQFAYVTNMNNHSDDF